MHAILTRWHKLFDTRNRIVHECRMCMVQLLQRIRQKTCRTWKISIINHTFACIRTHTSNSQNAPIVLYAVAWSAQHSYRNRTKEMPYNDVKVKAKSGMELLTKWWTQTNTLVQLKIIYSFRVLLSWIETFFSQL